MGCCCCIVVDYLCNRLAQRLCFLLRLWLFGIQNEIMLTFYNAVLESILRNGMAAWFSSLTVRSKTRLGDVVKTGMTVMGKDEEHQFLQSVYE